jgi:hypothetical protein
VAKAQASRDWSPEYVPPSIVPQRFKKGTLLRKAAAVSPAMILKVEAILRCFCLITLLNMTAIQSCA